MARKKVNRFILTSAQYNAGLNQAVHQNLAAYADHIGAELVILPITYIGNDRDLPAQVLDHVLEGGRKLNENIRISNFKVRPQQIDPLTGLDRFAQMDSTTIFASPKQRMRVTPNSNEKLPKVLMTTGSTTLPEYRDNRIGAIATMDHVYGAILVETIGRQQYHFRELSALKNGKFYDLGDLVMDGEVQGPRRPEALIPGDWHTGDTDPKVRAEIFNMIQQYQPKRLILHDFFNGHTINHHEDSQIVEKALSYKQRGHLSLEHELHECAKELEAILNVIPNHTDIYIVKSNHDEFLERYLQEGRFVNEPQNSYIGSRLLTAYLEGLDPLQEGLSHSFSGGIPGNVHFLARDDDLKVYGVQLGSHGDAGANGSRRGSVNSREKWHGKSVTGHSHTPERQRNTAVVGTSTHLKLRYNRKGASGWMNTGALVYDNGKFQMFNIINGKHRA